MVVRFTKEGQTLKAEDINGYLAILAFNAKIYTGESRADFSESLDIRPCLERDISLNMYESENKDDLLSIID